MRLLVLKCGSTVPSLIPRRGDFEDWFRQGLGLSAAEAPIVDPSRGDALPDPAAVPAIVVTGSPAMVTDDAPWSLVSEDWLAACVRRGVPTLAVCYGHQLLARALGGTVGLNPHGREIGTVRVALTAAGRRDPLLTGLPDELVVQESHSQSVLIPPPGAEVLAGNAHDPHQALRLGERAWGVQFHPEFDADIVRGYLAERGDAIAGEGGDPTALAAATRDSDHGRRILQRFLTLL